MSQGGVGERRDCANPIGGRLPTPSRIEGDVSVLVLGIGLLDRVSSFVVLRLGNRAIGIGSLGILIRNFLGEVDFATDLKTWAYGVRDRIDQSF